MTVDAAHSPWDVCRSLLLAAPSLSALRALTLRRVHPVTPRTVRQLLATLPALTHVTLDRCRGPGLDHRVMALGQQHLEGGGAGVGGRSGAGGGAQGGGGGVGGRREVQVVWVPEAGADAVGRDVRPRRFVRLKRLLTRPSSPGAARVGAGTVAAGTGVGAAAAGGEVEPAGARAGVGREEGAGGSSAVPAAGAGAAAAASEPTARLDTAVVGQDWDVGAGMGDVGGGGAEERRSGGEAAGRGVRGVGSARPAGGVVGPLEGQGGRGGEEAATAGGVDQRQLHQGGDWVVGERERRVLAGGAGPAAPAATARGRSGQVPPGIGPPCLDTPARLGVPQAVRTAGVDAVLPHRRDVSYWRRALRRLRGHVSWRLGACWTGGGAGVDRGEE